MRKSGSAILGSRLVLDGVPVVGAVVDIAWEPAGWCDIHLEGDGDVLRRALSRGRLGFVGVEGHVETEDKWYALAFVGETDGWRRVWCSRNAKVVVSDASVGRLRQRVRELRGQG